MSVVANATVDQTTTLILESFNQWIPLMAIVFIAWTILWAVAGWFGLGRGSGDSSDDDDNDDDPAARLAVEKEEDVYDTSDWFDDEEIVQQ